MKMTKTILAMAAAMSVMVGYAGDSAPFRIDTRDDNLAHLNPFTMTWDASWIGGSSDATVVIADNGNEIKRTTGAGAFSYAPTGGGIHELTYTTYIGGVAQSEIYTARWHDQYTATFNANGGTGGKSGKQDYGSAIVAPTVTREGYTFTGWQPVVLETVPASNVTYTAQWTANEYEVTFDAAGGVVEGEDGHAGRVTLSVTYDSEYGELPTASCDGYVFLGWTLDGAEVTATNIVKTASDHVLTAKWGIQVGNGVWEATICDDPITLGAPLVPPNGEVVIPATIAGRPVVGISAEAFAENTAVTGVTIPDGVAVIGDSAFRGCSGLTSVTMPERFKPLFGDTLNGCPIMYIEDVPFIMFGDTYAYHNTSWGDYIEMDLKKTNSMKVYVDGATPDSGIAHTHIALFEVAGASSKDEISPVVENLGFNGTLRAAVWTDEELRGAVLPPPSTADEWESDGRSIDSRTPNDISGSCNFSHDPDYVYVYESDDGEFNWPQALWPDNKAVDDRFWVSVECQPSEVGRWGGVDGGFRVWQSGTEVKSEKMYVTYKTEGAWPCATNLPALFRGLPLANSDRYGFDISLWDVIHVAYGVPLHAYWLDATSEKPGAPLSITLPEAGILYMSAYDGELDGISVENADAVERERVSWDEYEEMGSERYFYQYCADFMNRSVLAVKVNSAKTIRLVQEDDFEDYDIDRIQFFPNETKAVAVEASFVSIFDRNRYPRCSDNIGEYLQGYVTGTGVYRVGEMVALTAVPAPGEAFDHWELKYGNFPSGIDTTKTNLNFFVTDACAGTAEERMQMVVQAVWKAKRQIVATTENILQGMASGSGFYHDGASVMLAAQPAAGYAFAEWSDGFKTATRTVSVSGDAEYVARFVQLQTSPIEDVLGGGWTSGADGVAETVGHYDATAAGDMSVKFTAADEASAWVETVVTNGCRVSFDWKSSCEGLVKGKPYDYLAFMVDGERQGFICGDTGWTSVTNYVTGAGEHVLRWTFLRDDEGSAGEDCAWLARVAVAPFVSVSFAAGGATSGTSPEPITACIGESIVLPGLGSLVWPKHTFLGWSDGERQYAAGAEYSVGAASIAGQSPSLTAVWEANTLSAPVITAPETYEGESATVTIAADSGSTIFYTTDGTEPGAVRSPSAPYQWIPATSSTIQYQELFVVIGDVTVKAIAVRDDYFDSEVATAIVTRLPWTFGEYLNCPEQTFATSGDAEWTRVKGVSEDGYALKSGAVSHSQTSRLETVVSGPGTVTFACKVSGEIVKKIVYDGLAFCIDGVQQGGLIGNADWATKTFAVDGSGSHMLSWLYLKDEDGSVGEDCAWIDAVTWTPDESAAGGVAIQVDGMATAFKMASGGKTRTAEVVAGTKAEDVKVFVGGVDVTAGFMVAVDGTTASVVLREPFERTDDATVSSKPPYRENDDGKTVTLNVEVVPGLYYAADSAATIGALKRPGAAEPAKAGDALVVPKQTGAQGFYKVWVSDAPIE